MNRWYVVQTLARKEQLAAQHLQRQGFVTFCPLRARPPARLGRPARPSEPLFPCYLFVSFDVQNTQWRAVNGTIGVVRIVALGSGRAAMPTPVPEGLVELFQSRCDESGEFAFKAGLKAGDRVRVIGGPFDNLCATIETAGPAERAVIMLDFMARQTRVTVQASQLIEV
jgi:transcriptional antiterminator RfaH